MAAARHWRAVGIEARGGGALELSEFQLFDSSGRVDQLATLSCTATPTSGSLAALSDNDTATLCSFSAGAVGSPGFELLWDFGVGVTKDVAYPVIGTGSSNAESLGLVIVQSSTDGGATWVTFSEYGRVKYPAAQTLVDLSGTPDTGKTRLILHFDGADNSTSFVDSSAAARTVTRNGNTKISTTRSKFGGSSGYFDGVGDNLTLANGGVFDPLALPFTFEGYASPNASTFAGIKWLFSTRSVSGSDNGIAVIANANGKLGFIVWKDGTLISASSTTTGVTADTMFHWEFCSDGTMYRLFHNGNLVTSSGVTQPPGASNGLLYIGTSSLEDGTRDWPGYMDEVIVTIGECLHTTAFTPRAVPLSLSVDIEPKILATRHLQWSLAATGLPPAGVTLQTHHRTALDLQWSGRGAVTGTVSEKATPDNTPLGRRVRLIDGRSGLLAREQWSHPITGAYSFLEVDPARSYTVISYDHLNNYRAVVADNLTLANGGVELMP